MTHYLESLNDQEIIYKFDKFDAQAIKQCIINFFKFGNNQNDELWLYKVNTNKDTVGDTYIDAFVYKNGNVYKEIQKENRAFYKKIK